MDWIVS